LKNENIPQTLNTSNNTETLPSEKYTISIQEKALIHDFEIIIWPDNHEDYIPIYNNSGKGEYFGNVLDTKDIQELSPNIEDFALKVITLNYNYSLSNTVPNSSVPNKGRLTLENLNIKGKRAIETMPSYKFEYIYSDIAYNIDETDDWGFVKNTPEAWSLNKITNPIGGSININYEPDDYYREALEAKRIFNK